MSTRLHRIAPERRNVNDAPTLGLRTALRGLKTIQMRGRVTEVLGTIVKATGVRARVGAICELRTPEGGSLRAEVAGLRGDTAILTPFGPIAGLSSQTEVICSQNVHTVPIGPQLLGRVLDGFGDPIDGLGPIAATRYTAVDVEPPNALSRRPIDSICETRVRAIDAMMTIGQGQRMAVVAPVGVGKTTLLGMLARGTQSPVKVIALIGERGREVGDFLAHTLGADGLAQSVVVVATSDRPAIERVKCAQVATAIAEAFRDEGKHVVLLVDSITRCARALREIGLASGEAPTRRGFPPSVFAALPRLLERSGPSAHGAITAFYTMLVEGDEESDPIAEEMRSLLDGHISLSRAQAQAHRFPAIDILASLSRVMSSLVSPAHLGACGRIRGWLAKHREIETLVQMGEYRKGSDAEADAALENLSALQEFFMQRPGELVSAEQTWRRLMELAGETSQASSVRNG